ncbi:unnamed protein product, partial [Ixodes persulcatus]
MPFWNNAGRRARAGAGRGRPLPGGPPGQNGGANAPPSTRGGRPGSRRPDSRGRRPRRWPHNRASDAGSRQRQAGSADSASHRAATPQSGSGPPARGGPGTSRPPARLPSRSREGPPPQGGRAWSRRPCHTVATWTTWDGQRDLHFVSRQRWRDQPRPVHDTPGVEVPPPFLGHTLPPFELAPDLQDPCWLCRVPVVHLETHEASPRHQELLRAVGPPTCVEAALRLLQRDRPDLLTPAARELPEEGGHSCSRCRHPCSHCRCLYRRCRGLHRRVRRHRGLGPAAAPAGAPPLLGRAPRLPVATSARRGHRYGGVGGVLGRGPSALRRLGPPGVRA